VAPWLDVRDGPCGSGRVSPDQFALALTEVGVIQYRATLASHRQVAFDRDRILLGHVTAAAKHGAERAIKALAKVRE
jgi:hypothetical protein